MNLGKEIEIKCKNGDVHRIHSFNIFFIEIVNRDKRIFYLSKPSNNVDRIESYGRISNTGLIFEAFGLEAVDYIQIHRRYIVPKLRVIGRGANWRCLFIKTTVTTIPSRPNEVFRTEELLIGPSYCKSVKDFFFKSKYNTRVRFRNKPEMDEDAEYVYVFIDSITHIVSKNESYKRTIYLDTPICYGVNSYLIVEHSNKPLTSYIDLLSAYPVHFRVHQSYIVNYLCVKLRDRDWKYLVIRAFDNDLKEVKNIRIPIGRSYKTAVKGLFENLEIDQ